MVVSAVLSKSKYPLAVIVLFEKVIFGEPSVETKVHPVKSIEEEVLLYNSIHSSEELAPVPDQATSLITTSKTEAALNWIISKKKRVNAIKPAERNLYTADLNTNQWYSCSLTVSTANYTLLCMSV